MATFSRSFAATDTIISAASVTTGTNSSHIDLSTHEGTHVTVDADFPVSPTDDLIVEVYGALDGGTDYDDTPAMTFTIDNGTDPNQVSFLITGFHGARLTVKRSGSTDTITVTAKSRRWKWTDA